MIRYIPVPPRALALCGIGYAFEAGAEPMVVRLSAVLPQLQLVVRGRLHHRLGAGGSAVNTVLTLVGATNAASEIAIEPGSRFFGVSLTPFGWECAAWVGADECADRLIEGAAIWGGREQRLLIERVPEGGSDEAIMALLFDFVIARARRFPPADERRHSAIAGWIERAGHVSLDDLTSLLDVSPRQAVRITSRMYGATPKQLLIKYRTLRLATVVSLRPDLPLFDPEYEPGDGFYDQSHILNDFKHFVGFTPRQFARERGDFAREMLRLRWQAGARTALSLWS